MIRFAPIVVVVYLFSEITIALHKCEAFGLTPRCSKSLQHERRLSQAVVTRPSKQQSCRSSLVFPLRAAPKPSGVLRGDDNKDQMENPTAKEMTETKMNRDHHHHNDDDDKRYNLIGQIAISVTVFAAIGLLLESFWQTNYASNRLPLSAREAAATIHLLAYGIWLGSVFYTEFVSGLTMYQVLPLQTFGRIQAELFPKYFFLSTVLLIIQLFTLMLFGAAGGSFLSAALSSKATLILAGALVLTMSNLLYLEPVTTKVMLDMFDEQKKSDAVAVEETDRVNELSQQFGFFHTLSNGVDLICLCAAVLHGSYLASAMLGR